MADLPQDEDGSPLKQPDPPVANQSPSPPLAPSQYRIWIALMCGIVIVYAILTYRRNQVWRSEISLWSDAISKSPGKGRPYSARAAAYMKEGRYAEAMADLNMALQVSPGLRIAHSNRGKLHEMQGNYKQALADYTKAIGPDKRLGEAWYNRGTCCLKMGRFEEAVSDLTQAVPSMKRHAKVWVNRGAAYLKLGRFDKAIADFDEALQIAPRDAGAYQNRAIAHLLVGKRDEALRDIAACRMFGGDTREFERLQQAMRSQAVPRKQLPPTPAQRNATTP